MVSKSLFALLLSINFSLALPSHEIENVPKVSVSPRDLDDETPLGFIKTWAALGDSYAAGIGAGQPLGNFLTGDSDAWLCSRWNESYPNIMNKAPAFVDGKREFSFLACSGKTATQTKDEQVPKLKDKTQQLITLSAGGNDVGLVEILDACVYQWSATAAITDKCPDALKKASDTIDNDLFGWLDDLYIYTALRKKLFDDGQIYVTGYAQFWDANTDQCSDMSWKYWKVPSHFISNPTKLKKEYRQTMNELVIRINNKIKEVIRSSHAGKIRFVNIDPYVGILQGRFCEPGIMEPAANRQGLLFYNQETNDGTSDPWAKTELKRAPTEVSNSSFEGQIARMFEITLSEHPDWAPSAPAKPQGGEKSASDSGPVDKGPTGSLANTISSFLPDTAKRVFHPRPYQHQIIASLVIDKVATDRAARLSRPRPAAWVQIEAECQQSDVLLALETIEKPRGLSCYESEFLAPKEATGDDSTPVKDAIKQFCKNREGESAQLVTDKENIYDRWDESGWSIPKRQSLWLRATPSHYNQCEGGGTIDYDDCVDVLSGGLKYCNEGAPDTTGFRAQGNKCLDFEISLSASVHDGDPPWYQHVSKYPPPETQLGIADIDYHHDRPINCIDIHDSVGWNWDDAHAAIEGYCNHPRAFTGHDNYWSQNGVRVSDDKNDDYQVYADPRWCEGYVKPDVDDCRYAFRKIFGTTLSDDMLCYTYYRCASYMIKVKARTSSDFADVGKVDSDLSRHNLGTVTAGLNRTAGWNTTAPLSLVELNGEI